MRIIKSFSVCDDNGEAGDMFYIKHNSSNFTIIDCCLNCEDRESIVSEIIINDSIRCDLCTIRQQANGYNKGV